MKKLKYIRLNNSREYFGYSNVLKIKLNFQ